MITTAQLPSILNLFQEKERELKSIIGNLKLSDVENDIAVALTVKGIEKNLLLEQVSIGEPRIVKDRLEVGNVQPNYQNLWGGQVNVNLVTVEFDCTGSSELFLYRGGDALTMGLVYPPAGNRITIEIPVPKLDKALVVGEANAEMRITRELIKMNNPDAERWSNTMREIIKSGVENRKQELQDFYG